MIAIDQFRYIKIQPKTIHLITRLWGITRVCGVYSSEPRAEVYCVRLNFNISKLVYSPTLVSRSEKLILCGRPLQYRAFSHDVTAAILVYQNNEA